MAMHLGISQQMVGMGAIISYSGEIAGEMMPFIEKIFPVLINIVAIMGCFIAIPVIQRIGRKKTLTYGSLSLSISLGILSLSLGKFNFTNIETNSTLHSIWIMFVFIFIRLIFSISLGPLVWMYVPEIVQPNIVPYPTMLNWMTVAGVNLLFPILTALAGGNPAWVFFIFCMYMLGCSVINHKFLV